MKKILFAFILFASTQQAQAQLSIGPKLGIGAGYIRSGNLKDNMTAHMEDNPKIAEWSVKNRPGFYFGLGAFAQYDINDRFAILSELTYNSFSSATKFYREEKNLDATGKGDVTITDSKANFKTSMLSIPVLAKYTFNESGIYATGGLRFNFLGRTSIKSEEVKIKDQYSEGGIAVQTREFESARADMDEFGTTRVNFILGVGKTFDFLGKELSLDFRYNIPLTRTEMYTSNPHFEDNTTKNNDFFTLDGKIDAELDYPEHRLNDFRMGILEITASYALFKK